MTIEVTNIASLRLYVEPAGSFAADHTGTLGDYSYVPFREGTATATLPLAMGNPLHAQQYLDGYPTQIPMTREGGTLSFTLNLAPTGTAAVDATPQVTSALGRILKAVMGGQNLSTGDTVASGGSTTGGVVTAAAARNLVSGTAIGVNRGASAAYELRVLESQSTNTLVTKLAFSNSLQTADVVHGTATHFLTQDPDTSLQFIVAGAESNDRWLACGCQLQSMTMDLTFGQIPSITFTFTVANWLAHDETAGTITGTLAAATYSAVTPIHSAGEFLVQTVATATRPTPLYISSLTYAPSISYLKVTSPSADASNRHTVYRWRRARTAPVCTVTFVLPYEDLTYIDIRDAKTLKGLWYQMGNVAGSAMLIDVSTAQIVDVQRTDAGGLASQTVTCQAQLDSDTASTDTDAARSAFRIIQG